MERERRFAHVFILGLVKRSLIRGHDQSLADEADGSVGFTAAFEVVDAHPIHPGHGMSSGEPRLWAALPTEVVRQDA
jgi:hypothetical protein